MRESEWAQTEPVDAFVSGVAGITDQVAGHLHMLPGYGMMDFD